MLTLVFTGCKTETSQVTVYVEDKTGEPMADHYVFYADYASIILDAALPSPESLLTDVSDCWEVGKTNKAGSVTFNIPLSVAKLKYSFITYDEGTFEWVQKDVELRRGVNETVVLVVNR